MVMPMVVLAILAVVSGFWNVTGHFGAFMGHGQTHGFWEGLFHPLTLTLPWVSLILAGLGILLAYAMYSAKWLSAEKIGSIFKPFYVTFLNKYWFDEFYEDFLVKKTFIGGIFAGLQQVDTYAVDGTVNGVANTTLAGGNTIRKMHTGQLQLYGLVMGIGIVAIALVVFFCG